MLYVSISALHIVAYALPWYALPWKAGGEHHKCIWQQVIQSHCWCIPRLGLLTLWHLLRFASHLHLTGIWRSALLLLVPPSTENHRIEHLMNMFLLRPLSAFRSDLESSPRRLIWLSDCTTTPPKAARLWLGPVAIRQLLAMETVPPGLDVYCHRMPFPSRSSRSQGSKSSSVLALDEWSSLLWGEIWLKMNDIYWHIYICVNSAYIEYTVNIIYE